MTTSNTINDAVRTIFSNACSCSECNSGISPIAYFYDLLTYAYKNLGKKSSVGYETIGNISGTGGADFFATNFMQDFESVPISCSVLSEKMAYAKLAVESLIKYRTAQINTSNNANYSTLSGYYLNSLYASLLETLDIDVNSLQLTRSLSVSEKKIKAKELGLYYFTDSAGKDTFDYLYLDYSRTGDFLLSELNIENLFGVREVNSSRSFLNQVPISLASHAVFLRWEFNNIIPHINTNEEGFIEVEITYTTADSNTFTLVVNSKSLSGTSNKIAEGKIINASTSGQNTILFSPFNNSGLSGLITFTGFTGSTKRKARFSLAPRVLCWKQKFLLDEWQNSDNYNNTIPFVEPDLMDLEDISVNTMSGLSTVKDSIASIYHERKIQLNGTKNEIQNKGITSSWQAVYTSADIAVKCVGNYSYVLGISTGGLAGNYNHITRYGINGEITAIVSHMQYNQEEPEELCGAVVDLTCFDDKVFAIDLFTGDDITSIKCFAADFENPGDFLGTFNLKQFFTFNNTLLPNEDLNPTKLDFDKNGFLLIGRENSSQLVVLKRATQYSSLKHYLMGSSIPTITSLKDEYYNTILIEGNKIVKKDALGKVIWEVGKFVNNSYTQGDKEGEFNSATAINILNRYIFVLDSGNNRIQQFEDKGTSCTFVRSYKTSTDDSFAGITQVRYDKLDNLYALCSTEHVLRVYNSLGFLLFKIGKEGNTSGTLEKELNNPSSFCVDSDGYIYIADKGNNRVQIFDINGNFIRVITSTAFTNLISISVSENSVSKAKTLVILNKKLNNTFNVITLDELGVLKQNMDVANNLIATHASIDMYNRFVVTGTNISTSKGEIRFFSNPFTNSSSPVHEIKFYKTKETNTENTFNPVDLVYDATGNIIIANGSGKNILFISNNSNVTQVKVEYIWGNSPDKGANQFLDFSNNLVSVACNGKGQIAVKSGNDLFYTQLPKVLTLPNTAALKGITTNNEGKVFAYATAGSKTYLYYLDETGSLTDAKMELPGIITSLAFDLTDNIIASSDNDATYFLYDKKQNKGRLVYQLNSGTVSDVEVNKQGTLIFTQFDRNDDYIITTNLFDAISAKLEYTETLGLSIKELFLLQGFYRSTPNAEQALDNKFITGTELNYLCKLITARLFIGSLDSNQNDEIVTILLMIHKRKKRYGQWLDEEKNVLTDAAKKYNVFLSPLWFNYTNSFEINSSNPNKWLVNSKARKARKLLLNTRKEKLSESINNFILQKNIAEDSNLTILKDLLINDTNTKTISGVDASRKKDWLSERLFIDFSNTNGLNRPRVSFYLDILQGIFNRIRVGSIKTLAIEVSGVNPLDLALSDASFNTTWEVMSSYAAWRSAMFINFYPENLLLPSLRSERSKMFDELNEGIINNDRFNPETAKQVFDDYQNYLNDITSLKIATSLQSKIPFKGSKSMSVTRDVVFHFAQSSNSQKVYYSITELSVSTSPKVGEWICLQQLKDIEYIVGAAELLDEKSNQRKIVLMVKNKIELHSAELSILTYTIVDGKWSEDLDALELEHNIDGEYFIDVNVNSIKFPFDNGGFHATMEVSPEPFEYKDRLSWDSFNYNGTPRVPAVALSFYWSTCVFVCFLDFNNKKLVASKNFLNNNKTSPIYLKTNVQRKKLTTKVRTARKLIGVNKGRYGITNETIYDEVEVVNGYADYTLTEPASLNFEPQLLVRLPIGNAIESTQECFVLIGADRGTNWGISKPTSVVLNKYGNILKSNTEFKQLDIGFVEFSGFSYTISTRNVFSYWNNWKEIQVLKFNNAGELVIEANTLVKHFGIGSLLTVSQTKNTEFNLVHKNYGYLDQYSLSKLTITGGKFALSKNALTPVNLAPRTVHVNLNTTDLAAYTTSLDDTFTNAFNNTFMVRQMLAEAYYFTPMLIAIQLEKAGFYIEALDWYRLLYDYTLVGDAKKIYPGLRYEEGISNFDIPQDWQNDPYNPHAVATKRTNAYTRFTILSIVKCLLAYADSQFAIDNVETVGQARIMYTFAKSLIFENGLLGSTSSVECDAKIAFLDTFDTTANFTLINTTTNNTIWLDQWQIIKQKVRKVNAIADLKELCNPLTGATPVGKIAQIFATTDSTQKKLVDINQLVDQYINKGQNRSNLNQLVSSNRDKKAKAQAQQARDEAMRLAIIAKTRNQAPRNAAVFSQITGIEPAKLRAGVEVVVTETGQSPNTITVPVRMNALRQPIQSISSRISSIITKSTSFSFTKTTL